MQAIDYDHQKNLHTLTGAGAALRVIFEEGRPDSLLDVGCGLGMWLRAAEDLGVGDLVGIEGVSIPDEQIVARLATIHHRDLSEAFDLGRRFGMALCLETAEHLEADAASVLVESLTAHADLIFFSAAIPRQDGQHHVNCRWPAYWQGLFNGQGFACDDSIRWRIWDDVAVEPWYRQNLFRARRGDDAGREPRIASVVHPDMVVHIKPEEPPAPSATETVPEPTPNGRRGGFFGSLLRRG